MDELKKLCDNLQGKQLFLLHQLNVLLPRFRGYQRRDGSSLRAEHEFHEPAGAPY